MLKQTLGSQGLDRSDFKPRYLAKRWRAGLSNGASTSSGNSKGGEQGVGGKQGKEERRGDERGEKTERTRVWGDAGVGQGKSTLSICGAVD